MTLVYDMEIVFVALVSLKSAIRWFYPKDKLRQLETLLASPLKNRDWRRSSWTFCWKSLYKKFRRPRDSIDATKHWINGIIVIFMVYCLSPVYQNCDICDIKAQFNQCLPACFRHNSRQASSSLPSWRRQGDVHERYICCHCRESK